MGETRDPRVDGVDRVVAGTAPESGGEPVGSGAARDEITAELLIEQQRYRAVQALSVRERLTTVGVGGMFLAVAAAYAVLAPWPCALSLPVFGLLLVVYAVSASVQFEVGTGVVVPSQLALVPMLLLLPPPVVPLAVAGGLVLSAIPGLLRRQTPLSRALAPLASCWHALAPALVLTIAGVCGVSWSVMPVLVVALLAQFSADLASSAFADRIALGPLPRHYARTFVWVFLIDACLTSIGVAIAFTATDAPAAVLLVLPLVFLLRHFAKERAARIDNALELSNAYRGTALLLGDVIEADDAYTGSHSRDVVGLALAVVDELGLGPDARRQTEFVALLHDVGKIRIPSSLINKPGTLTPDERALMETHTIEGERLLSGVGGVLGNVGKLVRSCHERWDGKGYPDGLLADEIPLVSRIVCVCDAYSAMSSDRSYRKALPPEHVVRELRANAGTQFDPVVVAAFLRVTGASRADSTPAARTGSLRVVAA